MRSLRSGFIVVWVHCVAIAGCAAPFGNPSEELLVDPPAATAKTGSPVAPPGNLPPAALDVAPAGPPQPEQLVRNLPGLNPEAQARLLTDLKQTDPALWPKLVQAFQVAAANRPPAPPGAGPQQAVHALPSVAVNEAPSGLRQHPYHPQETAPVAPPGAAPQVVPAAPAGGLAQAFSRPRDPQAALASLNDPLDRDSGAATQVTYEAPSDSASSHAEEALADAIRALEREGEVGAPGSAAAARKAIESRLLCLAAGRRDDALRPIPGVTSAEQEYWSSQLFALAAWLDSDKLPAADRRANEALAHLDAARAKLAEIGGLQVRNPQFCTRVDGFGSFTKFKEYVFRPGQEVVLYVEMENFRSEAASEGYRTALSSRYRILDSQSRQVTEHEFPPIEEVCQNRRRDYYVSFRVTMPERVYDGRHTLLLTIEDTLGKKVGQTSIEFAVKE